MSKLSGAETPPTFAERIRQAWRKAEQEAHEEQGRDMRVERERAERAEKGEGE